MAKVIEQDIVVGEDGSVKREEVADKEFNDKLDLICEKINDPNFDPAQLSQWIAAEIAKIARDMVRNSDDPSATWRVKGFSEQVKVFRELGKQVTETDVLSKKDILNFDGPKFQFVLGVIVDLFVKAMKEAGVLEDQRTSVMKHYRDLWAVHDPIVRRETQKIDSNAKSK